MRHRMNHRQDQRRNQHGEQARLRVLVVDDQQLLRRGLTMLLDTVEGIEVVAQAADGVETLAVLARQEVDVVLTDARMPGMDGVELAERCRDLYPGLPVLVLTTFDDDELVRSALKAGAAGFLLKDSSVETVAQAIVSVHQGGLVVDPRAARAALSAPAEEPEAQALAVLTPAEREVAALVAQGLTNREIASRLVLVEGTVKNHVSALLRKLGSGNRTALALTLDRLLRPGGPGR